MSVGNIFDFLSDTINWTGNWYRVVEIIISH